MGFFDNIKPVTALEFFEAKFEEYKDQWFGKEISQERSESKEEGAKVNDSQNLDL